MTDVWQSDLDTLYVSCNKEAGPVTRFGALIAPGNCTFIGARRDPENPKRIIYDEDEVVVIPGPEFRRYPGEYSRALVDKSLRKRTREDYDAHLVRSEEAENKRATEYKAAIEKAQTEATKTTSESSSQTQESSKAEAPAQSNDEQAEKKSPRARRTSE